MAAGQTAGENIDLQSSESVAKWAKELASTEQQIRDAVAAVGDRASDVELHLKGVRSSTNEDQVENAPDSER